ncbi:nuclear transport factor 2 family protein [Aliiglaciecola sp. CAU 1673]|uniref:nuclear transport factor 2 family protein n=1 Tax=Aliiglaciecola sp. CAU 1673 TaxID=3032595 RepID=UPI0023DB570F|nr:nuclear transport factor 2 family protein [Aliiglaciecola sp. CAU 1673]MDF2178206.1 nuclear transport factor 2 family protein [Aliiglaciecola sp. CAU 1673]
MKAIAPVSEVENQHIHKDQDAKFATLPCFIDFYGELSADSIGKLSQLYSNNIEFVDPVKTHKGLHALSTYFDNLLENCEFCRFDIHSVDTASCSYFVQWQMHFCHKRLNGGQKITIDGISQVKEAAGKVVYQRDYYDLGAMLYEHVPLLGAGVRVLKKRLVQ